MMHAVSILLPLTWSEFFKGLLPFLDSTFPIVAFVVCFILVVFLADLSVSGRVKK